MRLGLRMAAGLSAEDGKRVAEARRAGNGSPYASVDEVVRRAGVGRRAIEALAEADGFAGMVLDRRAAMWDAKGVENDTPPLLRLAAQAAAAGDPPLLREPSPALPAEADGQSVVLDYTSTGLTLRQHPVALLRPKLRDLGCRDTRDLKEMRAGQRIKLAGMVLMRQRPGTAKGIVFITVEDEHGTANLVVYTNVGTRDRAALIGARLLVVEARVEREAERAEVPITHLICRKLDDRSDLLSGLIQGGVPEGWSNRAVGHADEVRRPDPGSARCRTKVPDSRDFH